MKGLRNEKVVSFLILCVLWWIWISVAGLWGVDNVLFMKIILGWIVINTISDIAADVIVSLNP